MKKDLLAKAKKDNNTDEAKALLEDLEAHTRETEGLQYPLSDQEDITIQGSTGENDESAQPIDDEEEDDVVIRPARKQQRSKGKAKASIKRRIAIATSSKNIPTTISTLPNFHQGMHIADTARLFGTCRNVSCSVGTHQLTLHSASMCGSLFH